MDQHTLAKLMAAGADTAAPQQQQQPTTAKTEDKGYTVNNGVAIVPVVGPIAKYADIFSILFGGVSTVDIQQSLDSALADEGVTAVLLYVDSPGGTVNGTVDLADAVAQSSKPTYAYISDSGNSAAYWVASQCDKVWINRAGYAGSIGVYTTVVDYSKAYEAEGIKVNLVKAGDYKGGGEPGTEVGPNVLAETQKLIDGVYDLFINQVADGRGMSVDRVRGFADGQTYIASEALGLGLVDAIVPSDQVINKILGEISMDQQTEETQPVTEAVTAEVDAEEVPAAVAAVEEAPAEEAKAEDKYAAGVADERQRFAGVVDACKGDLAFAADCFAKGMSVADAKLAYADKAIEQAATLAAQVKQLKASAGGAEPVTLAVAAVGGTVAASKSVDAIKADWDNNTDNVQSKFTSFANYSAYRRFAK
jgi:signal peptide peptidase SppA